MFSLFLFGEDGNRVVLCTRTGRAENLVGAWEVMLPSRVLE